MISRRLEPNFQWTTEATNFVHSSNIDFAKWFSETWNATERTP